MNEQYTPDDPKNPLPEDPTDIDNAFQHMPHGEDHVPLDEATPSEAEPLHRAQSGDEYGTTETEPYHDVRLVSRHDMYMYIYIYIYTQRF